jgi:creatinase
MVHEIARTFPNSEIRDTWVWFQSGINTDGAHNWATTRKIQEHDILSLNCFPMTSGYYTALERTLFYGEPDARSLELWNINVEVHKRGLELIKPGAVCKDIAAELNEIYVSHGLLANRTFGYGHSFGVLSHYYGREAGLELREDIDTVLEPGMVVSMEPMITVLDGQPGADDHRPGRPAGRRRLPRARHPRGGGRRRGEHHQVPVRPRVQHRRSLSHAILRPQPRGQRSSRRRRQDCPGAAFGLH